MSDCKYAWTTIWKTIQVNTERIKQIESLLSILVGIFIIKDF